MQQISTNEDGSEHGEQYSYTPDGFDANGQVMERAEVSTDEDVPDGPRPRQLFYYFNGMQVGDIGNKGALDVDYAEAIARKLEEPEDGFFPWDQEASSNFGNSYEPISSQTAAATGYSYTVHTGDTLQSIAVSLWGDAGLWYLIAEANGLNGSETLAAGRTLSVPNKVINARNAADTFRVYDPNKGMGDIMPGQPKPPAGDEGCGQAAMIIMIIVAVVVSVVTFGAALAAAGAALGTGVTTMAGVSAAIATTGGVSGALVAQVAIAGAVAGAAGSLASQFAGMVMHVQDDISWNAVAMGALSGAIGGAVGFVPGLGGAGPLTTAGRAVVGNVVTQGVAVATGLQDRFDWTSVAVAGVTAGAGSLVSGWVGDWASTTFDIKAGSNTHQAVTGTAAGVTDAAVRSLIEGSDFGDNLQATLPAVIAATIGGMIVGASGEGNSEEDSGTWAKGDVALRSSEDVGDGRLFPQYGPTPDPEFGYGRMSYAGGDDESGLNPARWGFGPTTDAGLGEVYVVGLPRSWLQKAVDFVIDLPSRLDRATQDSLRSGLDTQTLYAIAATTEKSGDKDLAKRIHAFGTFLGEQKAGIYRGVRDGGVATVEAFGNLSPVGQAVGVVENLGIDVPDVLPNANKVTRPLAAAGMTGADYVGDVAAGRRDPFADASSLAGVAGRAADKRYIQPLRSGDYETAARNIGGDMGYVEGTVATMVATPGSAPARGGVIATKTMVGGGEALIGGALTAERAAIATERIVAGGTVRSEAAISRVVAAEAERALPQAIKTEVKIAQANASARLQAPVHRGLGDLTQMEPLELNFKGSGLDGISVAANSVDDAVRLTSQQVKAKIIGTAQQTGNDGAHAFRSYREAILLARNPEVEAVYLNKGYNAGLELAPKTISPNRRPDVLARYFDGRVDRVEVFSKTDDVLTLRARNTFLDP